MRAGLIGQRVGDDAAPNKLRQDVAAIAHQTDGDALAALPRFVDFAERVVEVVTDFVAVTGLKTLLNARRIDVDAQKTRAVHSRGQRLRAAHPAHPAGDDQLPCQRTVEVFRADGGEGLERALNDALTADVDPRAGGHLAVHRQPHPLQPVKHLPVRPVAHEVRVGYQHARRVFVRAEDADGFARLHKQRFVVIQIAQAAYDGVEAPPVARRLARAAVNDQVVGALGDLRVEVVHQHPHRGLLRHAPATALTAARRSASSRFANVFSPPIQYYTPPEMGLIGSMGLISPIHASSDFPEEHPMKTIAHLFAFSLIFAALVSSGAFQNPLAEATGT